MASALLYKPSDIMTLYIIIITGIVSVMAFNNDRLFYKLQFNPYNVKRHNEWYRFISHALLHGDWMHLLLNMFVLFMFGNAVEHYFLQLFGLKGKIYFLLLYIGGVVFASLSTYKKYHNDIHYNSVGASGAVSAVLFSSIIFNPMTQLCLWGILCFPGVLWGALYLGYSWYMDRKGDDNINHDAHFWGALFGVVFTIGLKPVLAVLFVEQLLGYFQ